MNRFESLLYSTNEKFLLKEFFKIPAHQTAQEVVTIIERPLQNDYRLTSSDHTPFIGHPN
ncbi:MAG: hypothetical protein HOP07_05785 [Bacteriovoracaceae bacterium]|nr:hypothetical protein [Bacteriovoracaceae bacterium]